MRVRDSLAVDAAALDGVGAIGNAACRGAG